MCWVLINSISEHLSQQATGSADGSWGDKREVPERFKELLMASPIRKDRWVREGC